MSSFYHKAVTSFIYALLVFIILLIPKSANAQAPEEVFLWNNGAPGFESRKDEPSLAQDWWVKNIHNPTITVFKPSKETDKGIGVLICPGGGHSALVFNSEGRDAAIYLNSLGITAFVLKYRLAREENSTYKIEKHPKEDAERALRLIRSKAQDWNINPEKLGMMGFSAGGEVVSLVAFDKNPNETKSNDPIDQQNKKPDFIIMVYPGPIGIPNEVTQNAPPAFVVAANDDECCSGTAVDLLLSYRKAKAPIEAHLYSKGGHAFNMGKRTQLTTISSWPQRLEDWLRENIL